MNRCLPVNALVAAALLGIAAECAWSADAAPGGSAAPAGQTAAPGAGYVPGWYPPVPNPGGYAQPWQPAPQWPAPAPGYGQSRPYYPPYGFNPAANPLSARLRQAEEQLAAKSTELDAANERLATLQAELQAATETLQQAQSDTSHALTETDNLRNVLTELATRLERQPATPQKTGQAPAAGHDSPGNAPVEHDGVQK